MVTVGLWNKSDIDRIEAGQYRKIQGCNNSISNKAILNTMTSMKLAGVAVMQLSKGVFEQYTRQHRITEYFEAEEKKDSGVES